jgi:hypothetical protein
MDIDTPPCKTHSVFVWRVLQGGACGCHGNPPFKPGYLPLSSVATQGSNDVSYRAAHTVRLR